MVEVLHYEKSEKGKVIGYADLRVPILKPVVLILRKVAHLASGDKKWFNLASFKRQNSDGTDTYLKYAEFENKIFNSHLFEKLNAKIDEYCAVHGVSIEAMPAFADVPNDNELPF